MIKEVHHRVKNNFQLISSLLNLQAGNIQDEKTQVALFNNKNRIDSMALVHKSLYQNEDLVNIDLKSYVHQLVDNVKSSFNPENKNIDVIINIENIILESEQATPLGLIINEIITNAFKYAFKGRLSGKLEINAARNGDRYHLSICDNGVGLPQNFSFNSSDTLGMELVSLLSEQIDGNVNITHKNGTGFQIDFPKISS